MKGEKKQKTLKKDISNNQNYPIVQFNSNKYELNADYTKMNKISVISES